MRENIPSIFHITENEPEETATHDFEVEVGLFDDMTEEEKEVAQERIGSVLFRDRYKNYSEENKDIFKEIENGVFSRVLQLTELHPRIAQLISQKMRLIALPNVTIIYEDVALFLGNHEGGLYLSGLRTLEYGVAKHLCKHKGFIDLSGLCGLSDADADFFSRHDGELRLTKLSDISDNGLFSLAKHKGPIDFPPRYREKWEEHRKEIYSVRKAI